MEGFVLEMQGNVKLFIYDKQKNQILLFFSNTIMNLD